MTHGLLDLEFARWDYGVTVSNWLVKYRDVILRLHYTRVMPGGKPEKLKHRIRDNRPRLFAFQFAKITSARFMAKNRDQQQ